MTYAGGNFPGLGSVLDSHPTRLAGQTGCPPPRRVALISGHSRGEFARGENVDTIYHLGLHYPPSPLRTTFTPNSTTKMWWGGEGAGGGGGGRESRADHPLPATGHIVFDVEWGAEKRRVAGLYGGEGGRRRGV